MQEKHNAQFFIEGFEFIPDRFWTTGVCVGNGCFCALGHLGTVIVNRPNKLSKEFFYILKNAGIARFNYEINDGYNARYPQPTPKARILAALKDAKAKGY